MFDGLAPKSPAVRGWPRRVATLTTEARYSWVIFSAGFKAGARRMRIMPLIIKGARAVLSACKACAGFGARSRQISRPANSPVGHSSAAARHRHGSLMPAIPKTLPSLYAGRVSHNASPKV